MTSTVDVRDVLTTAARGLVEDLTRAAKDVEVSVQHATSDAFPYSVLITVSRPEGHDAVVIELSDHLGRSGEFLSAEVLLEDGLILTPALIRKLPPSADGDARATAARQFGQLLVPFLASARESIIEALYERPGEPPLSRAELPRTMLPTRSDSSFEQRVRRVFSDLVGTPLARGPVRLAHGGAVDFDLVSADARIVGHVKHTMTGRTPTTKISDLVLQLQQVQDANRRLLIVGPNSRPLRRWQQVYGLETAEPVEMWTIENDTPTKVG